MISLSVIPGRPCHIVSAAMNEQRALRSTQSGRPANSNTAAGQDNMPNIADQLTRLLSEVANIRSLQEKMVQEIATVKCSIGRLETDFAVEFNKVHASISECQSSLSEHKESLLSHGSLITNLERRVTQVEMGMSFVNMDASVAVDTPTSGVPGPGGPNTSYDIVAEVCERQKRAKNVMVFGMNESDKEKDTQNIVKLFEFLVGNNSVNILQLYRIGSRRDDKCRPLKVVLPNESDVLLLIRNASKLKSNPQFAKVYVAFDRTRRQTEEYRVVKSQLDERTKNGEGNIRIRYIHGQPKIVKSN